MLLVRMKCSYYKIYCRGKTTATYETRRPLAGSAGGHHVAQRSDQHGAARQESHKKFTQVRAVVRHKTLLLLWWIDGGNLVVEHNTLADKGCLRAAVTTRVRGCELSNLLTLSTIALGLLL